MVGCMEAGAKGEINGNIRGVILYMTSRSHSEHLSLVFISYIIIK